MRVSKARAFFYGAYIIFNCTQYLRDQVLSFLNSSASRTYLLFLDQKGGFLQQ